MNLCHKNFFMVINFQFYILSKSLSWDTCLNSMLHSQNTFFGALFTDILVIVAYGILYFVGFSDGHGSIFDVLRRT